MLGLKENRRPNIPRNLHRSESQLKLELTPAKIGNTYKIRIHVLFFMTILLFSIANDIPLNYENLKTKDIISSFDYDSGLKYIYQLDSNFKRNNSKNTRYKNHTLNPLPFLNSSQEIFINSFHFENSLAFMDYLKLESKISIIYYLYNNILHQDFRQIEKRQHLLSWLQNALSGKDYIQTKLDY